MAVPTRAAVVQASSPFIAEAQKVVGQRYRIVAYTGKAIAQYWSRVPLVIDLSDSTVAKDFPILQHHSTMLIIGHALSATNEGNRRLMLEGVVSAPSSAALEFVMAAKAGFPWRASVGASVRANRKVDANEEAVVNGRTFKGPVDVISANFYETSILPLPADDETSVSLVDTQKET